MQQNYSKMPICVAVIQMVSSSDVEKNQQAAYRLLQEAKIQGAKWAVLPEYWALMGKQDEDKLYIREREGQGPLQHWLKLIAKQLQLTIFAGSLSLDCADEQHVFNSLLTISAQGECLSRYDKKHLFAYRGTEKNYHDAATIKAGDRLPSTLLIDHYKIAQGICFDLRFPEFFRQQLPFDVLILPAAFTYETGAAHWEVLLRARAIENQCYVLASAQGGVHDNGRHTFGHSMIIDPWGKVLVCVAEGEKVALAHIVPKELETVRSKLPVF